MTQKVLVVDDDLHLVHIVSYALKRAGYELLTAHNGRDGYETACKHSPNLVITDFQMPGMNGFEMAVQLRDNTDTAHVPVIMITARGHKIPPNDLSRTNIQAMLAKPFSARDLVERVNDFLNKQERPSIQNGNQDGEGHAA